MTPDTKGRVSSCGIGSGFHPHYKRRVRSVPMDADRSSSCPFCEQHEHMRETPLPRVVFEDQDFLVKHVKQREAPEGSAYLGWMRITLKRHVESWSELSQEESRSLGDIARRVVRALETLEGVVKVYTFVLGDQVPHFHIHVFPRYRGAPREFWGTRVDEWPDAPRGDDREIAEVCRQVSLHLNG